MRCFYTREIALQYTAQTSDLSAVENVLAGIGVLQGGEEDSLHRIYFETFDWRLIQAGLVLWGEGRGRQDRLVLAASPGGEELVTVPFRRRPRFYQNLPEGALRQRLAPVMEMRALMPVAEIDTRRTHHRLLNEDGKTVVRVMVDQPMLRREGEGEVALPHRVTLQPVRGYEEWLHAASEACDGSPLFEAVESDLLTDSLTAMGRQICDYSSKLDISLAPGMRADLATKRILRTLLDTMEANIEGTRADVDSEFLHDLRVAIRRTRSALSQIKQVFEPEVVEKYREAFGWLGQITGPTRDLDVYLLEYDSYRDSLPAAMRGDLAPFHAFLERSQKKAQRALKRQLDSERFATLRQDWRRFLQQPVVGVPSAANAALPVKAVADRRIWRMYKRVLREGRAITPESPAEDLHELRKSCKKLRYLIEFFSSLYDEKSIKPLVKALKRLLDNLGEFQDLEVHAEHLHDFAAQMQKQGEVPLETLLAMGALVGGLLQRQQSARQAFAECFEGFDTRDNRASYRRLFKPHAVGEEEARA